MNETIHGNRKRIEFLAKKISQFAPRQVLDVGCGNGVFLTIPLAEQFPNIKFIGIDSDKATIDLANEANTCKNLIFLTNEGLKADEKFDFVIGSEVIEHVDDPESFLDWLYSVMAPNAKLVITTPNGYGPFELTTFFETLFDLLGIMKALSSVPGLRKLKVGDSYTSGSVQSLQHDTLAISPHVNFFSLGVLTKIFHNRGFQVVDYSPRSFLGGLGFNQLMKSESVLSWNSRISDSLPKRCVSGWMFVLEQSGKAVTNSKVYRRRWNERVRRALTAKRWGTDQQ